jgi:hypothetical protein
MSSDYDFGFRKQVSLFISPKIFALAKGGGYDETGMDPCRLSRPRFCSP